MINTKAHNTDQETRTTRVFVVDDHALIRRGIEALLAEEPDMEVAGEADSILGTAEQIPSTRPDVLLIDLNLGRESGFDLLRYIQMQWVGVRTIVVSQHPPDYFAEWAIEAGASGYVCKESVAEQLIEAIDTVRRGGYFFAQAT